MRINLNDNYESAEPPINISEIKRGRTLGEGEFGTTYLATSPTRPNETLVLKIIPKITRKPINPTKHNEMVNREAEIIRDLKENCKQYSICFVDFQEDTDNYYILTAYDDNFVDLEKYLNELNQPIDLEILIIIMDNLLNGLKYLHQHGVLHRDIKPANIIFNPETGQAKIIDFGMSCRTAEFDSTPTNLNCLKAKVGSPIYTSPEKVSQLLDVVSDPEIYIASDIWSLGLVFHELLSARPHGVQYDVPDDHRLLNRIPEEFRGVVRQSDNNSKELILSQNKLARLLRGLTHKDPPGFNFGSIRNHPLAPVVKPMLNPRMDQRATIDQSLETLNKLVTELN